MSKQTILRAAIAMLLALAAAAVMWPGIRGPFVFDDYPNIVNNPLIQSETLDWDALERAARGYQGGPIGRPLASIGFAVDFAISGKDPVAYKIHNMLLHAINACLVFALMLRLFALPGVHVARPAIPAGLVALAWAIHPQQVSTVLYVVQRMEMLWVTFTLLALLAYLRGRLAQIDGRRGWPWLAGSVLLAGVGLLGKESAILLPAFTLCLELTVLGFAARSTGTATTLRRAYGVAAIAGAAVFLAFVLPRYLPAEAYAFRDFTLGERLLTQFRVLPMYLGQMLLPTPGSLGFYYDDLEISRSLLAPPTTLAGALLLAALLFAAFRMRRRWPLFSLGILWFFAGHFLTSNVHPLELAFEHRNYFPLAAILLAVADVVRRMPSDTPGKGPVIAASIAIAFFAFLGVLRSATWGSELHLAVDLVSKNPASPRASNDLATLYVGMADGNPASPFFSLGMQEFERGMKLPMASTLPEQGLILSAASTGQPVRQEWWDSLLHKTRTRPLGPQESMAIMGLVNQRSAGTPLDDEQLAEAYTILAERTPLLPHHYAQLGDHAITRLRDPVLAEEMFKRAVDASLSNPDYVSQIVRVLISEGHGGLAAAIATYADRRGVAIK